MLVARTLANATNSAPQLRTTRAISQRESEILCAFADGQTDKQIAGAMGVSIRTVRTHVERLYLKLGVHSRAGAVATWLQEYR